MRELVAPVLLLAVGLLQPPALALDVTPDRGAAAVDQALRDLTTDRRVLCFAAHPDDEDLATLAYLRKALGVRTHAVLATRGEGGQNEIGPQLDRELGVIRTREMAAAAAVCGHDVSFLNLEDFGYSKSAEETLERWGRDELVRRVVEELREHRPHVVITNHDEHSGHGHHQALGRALLWAWDAIAAGEEFPALEARGLEPWLPEALYVRVWREEAAADVALPVGTYDPVRGLSYAEIALGALQLHRSQGRWERDLGLGPIAHRYRRVRTGREDFSGGFFGGREPPWLPEGSVLEYARPQAAYALSVPDLSLKTTALGQALDLARMVWEEPDPQEARELARLEGALMEALALRLEVTPLDAVVTPSQPLRLRIRYAMAGSVPVTPPVFEVLVRDGGYVFDTVQADGGEDGILSRGEHGEVVLEGRPMGPAPTLPAAEHLYERRDLTPPATVVAHLEVAAYETRVQQAAAVQFDVAPEVLVELPPTPTLVRPGEQGHFAVAITAETPRDQVGGTVTTLVGGESRELPFTVPGHGGRTAVLVPYAIEAGAPSGDRVLPVTTTVEGLGEQRAGTHLLRVLDVQVAGDPRVGVVHTYDDALEQALDVLGVRHTRLPPEVILAGDLGAHDVIILDLRAYLARPDVVQANGRLLAYVRQGGTLLVMYNKLFEWNPGPPGGAGQGFGPFPMTLTRARVTREDAAITLLAPAHPVLSCPNRITPADLDGWIQERGLYYPTTYDERYTELLACSDPGEEPLRGGLLYARLGEGHYVYTSMVWYRQWRIAQPGAYRVLANLLSLPQAPREE